MRLLYYRASRMAMISRCSVPASWYQAVKSPDTPSLFLFPPLPRRQAAAVRSPPGPPTGLPRPAPPSMVLPSRAGQGYVSVVKGSI
jgi:hypothetical protein